ncbi:related to phosphatidylinositol 4-kinase [Cephalotrichum gorgonifer]|uniref:1-phosphatidylinositol 4-kinase n=1 Tax=Cephalotrichum gorgonifer TaxID=2041049 RepID=A0AAE8MYD9_9PEZI|nr:related to phosphatidylinositol 4-kinase [Cephalotrichum gorgonifer]
MSWTLLQRFLESDVFNSNPFLPVSYLTRYADHVGIQYVLCNKLRQFPYEDIEFFLPQLCHVIITVNNESMALEEFLLDLCEESVTAALLTFWIFQTYLHDLSANPQSESFQTCRRVYNKVQHIVFGLSDTTRHEKIRENTLPVTVLSSFILASIAVPMLPSWAGPLAVAQARKPQQPGALISDSVPEGTKLTRSHTVSAASSKSKPKRPRDGSYGTGLAEGPGSSPSRKAPATTVSKPRPTVSSGRDSPKPSVEPGHRGQLEMLSLEARLSSSSLPLPETRTSKTITRPSTPVSAGFAPRPHDSLPRRHSHQIKARRTTADLTATQKIKLLRQNYFRSETQFLTALESISNRLVIVPKLARLSALRAELALIAQDLPAEVDIPVLCPPTLVNGSPSKSKHHRIVRLNPAEATVLNSAEKVPYLLMVEILREDFTFDPDTAENERLLATLLSEEGPKRRLFDLTDAPRVDTTVRASEPVVDSVFEPTSGDLGNSPLLRASDDGLSVRSSGILHSKQSAQKLTIPAAISSTSDLATRLSSENLPSGSTSPHGAARRRMTLQQRPNASIDQPDFSALATHMRTAAQMLSQLEATSGKRPKHEVEAIRSKIIASMQSLEEESFDFDDVHGPTFDTIMAKASAASASAATASAAAAAAAANNLDLDVDSELEPTIDANAGVARMENDFKTGGLQRKGDRDDPSAAVFGEAWQAKRERIRSTSPYGWMKNWDLMSVIVKTGSDLRQEAFACQLIRVCHKTWVDEGVDVWVKLMRILVTGEASGLVETITNGVSLHSIRRSLTLASIESGQNPRRRMATLKDHFRKAFGAEDGEAYRAGVDAFKRSLAAYSILSYILQLKDRHNGNVLIDSEGHIVHIDFGFMLSNSPGSVGFEAAPFKLTYEYVEVLGGVESKEFEDYKRLCKQAFQALRRSADNIIDLVAMMGQDSKMPCFSSGVVTTTNNLRQRFQLQLSADAAEQFVEQDLIGKSLGSYYTRL